MRRQSWWIRVLAVFLLWSALRAAYTVYLGEADADYGFAAEQGFGPLIWISELLYAFLAVGAVVAIWTYSPHAFRLGLLALSIYGSIVVFQAVQVERDPIRARIFYAESRRARGLPMTEERLDQMFSEGGRRATFGIAAVMALGPLAILIWRRWELEGRPS